MSTSSSALRGRTSSSGGLERTRNCPICTDDKPAKDFLVPSTKCTHAAKHCRDCLIRHARELITGKGATDTISCPDCSQYLSIDEAVALIKTDPDLSDRYDKTLLNSFLRKDPHFRWCTNPSGCGSGAIVEGGADTASFMTCYDCGAKTCMSHRVPWHSGMTCAEYDASMAGNADRATEGWKQANTKPCPRCGVRIEKNDGCDVMRHCIRGDDQCRRYQREHGAGSCEHGGQCGQRFCWLCLGLIDEDGTRHHKPTCRYPNS